MIQSVGKNDYSSLFALDGLASLKEEQAILPLLDMFSSARPGIQLKIIETLGRINNKKATFALIELVKSSDRDIQIAAITALGRIADPDSYELISGLVTNPDVNVARAAICTLGMLRNPRAVPLLLRCMTFPNARLIIEASSAIKSSIDFSGLLNLLQEHGGIHSFAVQCPIPWMVYEMLYSYVAVSPPNVWSDCADDLADLTAMISRPTVRLDVNPG
jgi:hypothetical protein